jgi:molybdopterin-guanine dinucleotide biosynthesis protein A
MGNTIGAILAGGKATRMGTDKALVSFRGRPMLSHVAGALQEAGLDVLVVGREIAGYRSVLDTNGPGSGPLMGLLTALTETGGDVFLVAVDQPLLRPATVRRLIEQPGHAVVPFHQGHPQVTCSLFRVGCLDPATRLIASGERKLRRLLDQVETTPVAESVWTQWDEDGRSWLSLDTPTAVKRAEALR